MTNFSYIPAMPVNNVSVQRSFSNNGGQSYSVNGSGSSGFLIPSVPQANMISFLTLSSQTLPAPVQFQMCEHWGKINQVSKMVLKI